MPPAARSTPDQIDLILRQWGEVRPDLRLDEIGTFGRLITVAREWEAAIEAVFAGHGLTGGEFDVLAALRRSGPDATLTPSRLAAEVVMSRAGMTSRLDRLEAAGLVARRLDPDDRRSFLVALTAAGRKVVDAAASDHVAALGPLMAGLGAGDRGRLDRLLRKIGPGSRPAEHLT